MSSESNNDAPTIMLAGGGSGGHIYPGLAIAERIVELKPGATPIFVCSERPVDRDILDRACADYDTIPALPFSVRPRRLAGFARGYVRSRTKLSQMIRERRVCHVVALGGFVAAPVILRATAMKVPVTLVNLDAPPGRANRWMARRCNDVVSAPPLPMLPGFASRITGMPIRREALNDRPASTCRAILGLEPDRPTLLVVGGSQGAGTLNAFMRTFACQHATQLQDWQVLHLAGADDAIVRNDYARSGIDALVLSFSEKMNLAWGAADLAVSRSGASSVAEAAGNRVPTLFLPYPFHRDQHQRLNAEPLVASGAARIVRDRVDPQENMLEAGQCLLELLASADQRAALRSALERLDQVDAASALAAYILDRC